MLHKGEKTDTVYTCDLGADWSTGGSQRFEFLSCHQVAIGAIGVQHGLG